MNKAIPLFACAVATSVGLAAIPQIDQGDVSMSQDQSNGRVSVKYTLKSAPAVVTLDFETNYVENAETKWASIGGENIQRLKGPVNKVVRDLDRELTIIWRPDKDWPGKKLETGGIRAVVKAWALEAPPPYMVVDLTVKSNVTYYASEKFVPGKVTDAVYKTDKLVMRLCPAANVTWRMGSPESEKRVLPSAWGAWFQESEAARYVTLSNDFYIGVYPVTQAQFRNITTGIGGLFPAWPANALRPVAKLCWNDLRAINYADNDHYRWPQNGHDVYEGSQIGLFRSFTGVELDLPTEAQWEFACRAGRGSAFNNGVDFDSDANLVVASDEMLEVCINGLEETVPVGGKKPNDWGIYDMHGNVWELCLDASDGLESDHSGVDPEVGPVLDDGGVSRVCKGGSYNEVTYFCRAARRYADTPSTSWMNTGIRFASPAVAR